MVKFFFLKSINIVLGYPLYIISFFSPRNNKKIVIGSHTPFNDNSKYFYLLSQTYLSDYKIIWITSHTDIEDRLKGMNLLVYKQYSLKGLYHSLSARYYIYSFHLPDINFWTSARSIKFNLWHGIPLKDIAFATKHGPSSKIYNEKSIFSKFIRPHVYVRPDYMLTTSTKMSKYFAQAFRIGKEQCLEYGMPRCDILSWEKKDILSFINIYESNSMKELVDSFSKYRKVFIYMPTWREEIDFLLNAGIDFERLNERLTAENVLILFKLHPFTKLKKINLLELDAFSHIIIMNKDMDIYPILPFTDCLITDYSSIYYDYLFLNKPVYLFPYDYNSYVESSRSLAFDYENKMPGIRVKNFEELLNLFSQNIFSLTQEQKEIVNEYFGTLRGNSVKELSNFIKKDKA